MIPNDAYWDSLGVAWVAVEPDSQVIGPRLKARLRWQSWKIRIFLALGGPLSVLGVGLGLWTIWRGWSTETWNFVTRGVAIAAICVLLAFALGAMAAAVRDRTKSLADMIALASARTERWLLAIRLGYWACTIAAALGLIGTALRSHFTRPPALSPFVPLAVLALGALILFFLQRVMRDTLMRYRHLQRALALEDRNS